MSSKFPALFNTSISNTSFYTIENILNRLQFGDFKNISFLLGAGVSTSSGIPDFRSKQGRYVKVKEQYGITKVEDFFSLNFFKKNPEFFYDYLGLVSFDKFSPTITHHFMKLVEDKGFLNKIYTQNIDSLEEKAKISRNKIVYAHGNINEAVCSKCRKQHCIKKLRSHIEKKVVMYCDICSSPCKYSIVFFGEPLPKDYFDHKENLVKDTDLVFIIGTSLIVKPFAHLVNLFPENIPKILINQENLLEKGEIKKFINHKDSFINLVGNSDEIITSIVDNIGWTDDINKRILI